MSTRMTENEKQNVLGQTFSKLTVVGWGRTKDGGTAAVCQCECGGSITRRFSDIKRGAVKSCGCARRPSYDHLVGETFGKLTIAGFGRDKRNNTTALCNCECGNNTETVLSQITGGHALSCGCTRPQPLTDEEKQNAIGQTFGRLTVLSLREGERNRTYAVCKCECGNTVEKRLSDIKQKTRSCGCLLLELQESRRIDVGEIIGQRFGRLVPSKEVTRADDFTRVFEAQCDCGNTTKVKMEELRRKDGKATRSCGCLSREKVSERSQARLLGQKFSRLTVVEHLGSKDGSHYWRCECACGEEVTVPSGRLTNGNTKSCGCLQREATQRRNKEMAYATENEREAAARASRARSYQKAKENPAFVLNRRIRSLFSFALKRVDSDKTSSTFEMLGYSLDQLRDHLENKFTTGMGWHNIGEWHIDHIVPSSTAKTREDVIKLNQLDNLQPLWAEINLAKGNRLDFDTAEAIAELEEQR